MEEIAKKKGFPINQTGLIAFIVVVLVLASLGTFIAGKNGPQNPAPTESVDTTPKMTTSLAPQTLIYGTWTQSNSLVKAIDLSNGKYQTIAALPVDIKKITVASPDTLIYINRTNEITNQVDQGKEISIYSLTQNKVTATLQAEPGFAIDDYVVSPNKKYLATWELAFAPGSSIPRGGRSRVYAVNLANPSVKNLIYDEEASDIPVHYPSAIVDNGRVFSDTFLSNSGPGYSYGMSVANLDGTGKQDLDQMKNGTYGTQPALSPDGTKLAFAGYDGSDGATLTKSGFRKAILAPNTVETLDVNSLTRQKLANLPNTNIYVNVRWDRETGNLLLGTTIGLHKYNLATSTLKKINTQKGSMFIATLSPDKTLKGAIEASESCLANLGAGYQSCFRQFTVQDSTTSQETSLPLPDPLMQLIEFASPNYFSSNVSSAQANVNPEDVSIKKPYFIDLFSTKNNEKENLQLYTFLLKSDLAPKRQGQQSDPIPPTVTGTPSDNLPRCRDLAAQQCKSQGLTPGSDEFDDCEDNLKDVYKDQDACDDSPLYLYGAEGQKVKVNVNTYVYNSQPGYDNGYEATLLKDGKMLVNGTTTDSIKYNFTPGIKKINPPSYGKVTTRKELSSVLTDYSQKIGLNQKETEDLRSFAEKRITSPYVFVSFFNQKKSEEILPLSFSPKPDNYLNIVFYFKQYGTNPSFTPIAPVFSTPLNRSGFTAVEISELVE